VDLLDDVSVACVGRSGGGMSHGVPHPNTSAWLGDEIQDVSVNLGQLRVHLVE
jgi:hypothetical protein